MNKLGIVADESIGTPSQVSLDSYINGVESKVSKTIISIQKDVEKLNEKIEKLQKDAEKYKKQLLLAIKSKNEEIKKRIKEEVAPIIDKINKKIDEYEKRLQEYKKQIEKEIKKIFPGSLQNVTSHMKPPLSILFNIYQNGLSVDLVKIKDALMSTIEYLVQPYIRYQKLAIWWGTNGPKLVSFTASQLSSLTSAFDNLSAAKSGVASISKMLNS